MMNISTRFSDYPCAYSLFDCLPEERQLCNYEDQFAGRDVWKEYVNDQYSEEIGDRRKRQLETVERKWKQFCEKKGCHHALASPAIINDWCEVLLDGRKPITVSRGYLRYVNKFYRYLMWNEDYPHTYNPVQFAVNEFETVAQVDGLYRHGNNE